MALEYVREAYRVPAEIGGRVVVNGRPGVIVKDCGHYIGVHFSGDRPNHISRCHPLWRVEYLEQAQGQGGE